MAKKKSSKGSKLAKSGGGRPGDKMMADLQRLLSQQNFSSAEEVNKFMQELMASSGGFIPEMSPRSSVEQAQDVMYKAWESPNRTQRLKLARQALEISPDCADAYVLLAQESAKTPAEARALYEQGVSAGERVLKDEFEELKGHFWGFHETRPYMRARLGLAQCLWELGELDAAAAHMAAMLELNPGDNQGVRYLFITLLLELEDSKRLEKLLKQYPDDWSAYWKYSAALYEFRKQGRGGKADKLLTDAIVYNPHVPPFLLSKQKLPKQMAGYYSPGDQNEAMDYVLDGIRPWTKTEGALNWLRDMVERQDKSDPSS
ncbi:MAG: tetratricopeptide repeat protein [Chloroflexota bacterium]|nr:tetratricopeptide repeat protein [Chloroflexota bacterium]